jgi:hypothetical protein
MLELVLIVSIIVLFDLAALRWGADSSSRDGSGRGI